jgi:hypothetical protein
MQPRTPLTLWTALTLAAIALALWGGAMLVLIDADRFATHL